MHILLKTILITPYINAVIITYVTSNLMIIAKNNNAAGGSETYD